jgi:cytochrome P450
MLQRVAGDEPFYPPHVRPVPRPLPFPFYLPTLLGNNLAAIPAQAYERPIVLGRGPPRMAWITGPEAVKAVLLDRAHEFPKGYVQNEIFRPLFGNAMITAEGRDWRWQRGAAAPLFRHDEIVRYGEIMARAAEATVAQWRATGPDRVHPIHTQMMHAAFAVIAGTMLAGTADDAIDAIEKGHAGYFAGVNWWTVYTIFRLPHWLPRPGGRAMRAHEGRLRAAMAGVVEARHRGATTANDLIAKLLASPDPETGREMSDELLIDNAVAFLMAGYDTTALALTWTLYLVSQSPAWEARMREEIDAVVGSGPVTAAHASKLVTVQQVLNESLRLYPTAPVILRDFPQGAEIGGTVIPAGTVGIIPIYAIHRHRSFWSDPDRFDPARFAPDNPVKPSRYQFMPFGAGPRICIGATFAMIEATIMLATFVRAARFAYAPMRPPEPSGQMFLLPKGGMFMRVIGRDNGA